MAMSDLYDPSSDVATGWRSAPRVTTPEQQEYLDKQSPYLWGAIGHFANGVLAAPYAVTNGLMGGLVNAADRVVPANSGGSFGRALGGLVESETARTGAERPTAYAGEPGAMPSRVPAPVRGPDGSYMAWDGEKYVRLGGESQPVRTAGPTIDYDTVDAYVQPQKGVPNPLNQARDSFNQQQNGNFMGQPLTPGSVNKGDLLPPAAGSTPPTPPNVSMTLDPKSGASVPMVHTGNVRADSSGNIEVELHPPGSPGTTMWAPNSKVTPLAPSGPPPLDPNMSLGDMMLAAEKAGPGTYGNPEYSTHVHVDSDGSRTYGTLPPGQNVGQYVPMKTQGGGTVMRPAGEVYPIDGDGNITPTWQAPPGSSAAPFVGPAVAGTAGAAAAAAGSNSAQAQPAPNPAAGITGAIHSMMSDPTKIDTSKYDGSAAITQSQSDALPWWQQTHDIVPDAAIPPAEADPAYVKRLAGAKLLPGVSMTRQQGANNLMPVWLSNYLNQ